MSYKRKIGKVGVSLLLLAALVLTGCKTTTSSYEINPRTFLLCDGEDNTRCGSNPEKGLYHSACLEDGRYIANLRQTGEQQLLVTCGPEIPEGGD